MQLLMRKRQQKIVFEHPFFFFFSNDLKCNKADLSFMIKFILFDHKHTVKFFLYSNHLSILRSSFGFRLIKIEV